MLLDEPMERIVDGRCLGRHPPATRRTPDRNSGTPRPAARSSHPVPVSTRQASWLPHSAYRPSSRCWWFWAFQNKDCGGHRGYCREFYKHILFFEFVQSFSIYPLQFLIDIHRCSALIHILLGNVNAVPCQTQHFPHPQRAAKGQVQGKAQDEDRR